MGAFMVQRDWLGSLFEFESDLALMYPRICLLLFSNEPGWLSWYLLGQIVCAAYRPAIAVTVSPKSQDLVY